MDWNCATRVLFERSRIHCEWIRMLVSKVVTYIQQHCAMWHIVKPSAKKKKHAKRIDEYFTFALSSFHFVCVVHFSDWSICIQWNCYLNDTSSKQQHSDWIDWLNMSISIQSTKRIVHFRKSRENPSGADGWKIYWEQIRLKWRIGYGKLKVIPLNFQCHLFDVNLLHYWNSHLSFHLVFTCSICDSVVVCRSITDSK